MGALRPPNPPTTERRGANFWRAPQLTAPLFLATDDRERSKNRGGAFPARGVWGAKRPHIFF